MFGRSVTVIVPLTTRERPLPNRVKVTLPGKPDSWAITEQPRTVSLARLSTLVTTLSAPVQTELKTALRAMIDIS